MKPLTNHDVRGTWATLLLPLDTFEAIDFGRLEGELDYLLASGVDGIYTNGTAGEFYAQSEGEFDRIHALLASKCEKARMAFQIGVSHPSAQLSLTRLKRVRQLQPGAVQIILPDWWPPAEDEALDFVRRFAEDASPIPLVLYNPPHAKCVLSPKAIGRLADAVPELIGIKVASGGDSWYEAIRALTPRLSVFIEGHRLATGIHNGASGSYSNVACLHPIGAKHWNQLMATDMDLAMEMEQRIVRFLGEHILPHRETYGYSNQALDKLLAAIGNWAEIGTRLRWPYKAIPESEADRLRPIARTALPELFAN